MTSPWFSYSAWAFAARVFLLALSQSWFSNSAWAFIDQFFMRRLGFLILCASFRSSVFLLWLSQSLFSDSVGACCLVFLFGLLQSGFSRSIFVFMKFRAGSEWVPWACGMKVVGLLGVVLVITFWALKSLKVYEYTALMLLSFYVMGVSSCLKALQADNPLIILCSLHILECQMTLITAIFGGMKHTEYFVFADLPVREFGIYPTFKNSMSQALF